MKVLLFATILGITSCAMPERKTQKKPKFLTKSAKMRECVESFVYRYEVEPKVAVDVCQEIYRKKSE